MTIDTVYKLSITLHSMTCLNINKIFLKYMKFFTKSHIKMLKELFRINTN